jgi:hypothetical protein
VKYGAECKRIKIAFVQYQLHLANHAPVCESAVRPKSSMGLTEVGATWNYLGSKQKAFLGSPKL